MAEKYILTPDQQKVVEENLDLADILLRTKIHPNETIRGMEFDELYQCGCLALCRPVAQGQNTWESTSSYSITSHIQSTIKTLVALSQKYIPGE